MPFTYPHPLKLFHLRKSMNKSLLVTRSCNTSIFIYFSDLAVLSNAVRDFFFLARANARRGLGSCRHCPRRDLRLARGGARNSGGRKLHWPVGPRLHLRSHGVDSLPLHLDHSRSLLETTALLWVGEDASQRRRGCRRRVRFAQSSPGLGSALERRPLR